MNKILLISISAWAITQVLKVVFGLAREKHLDLRYFVAGGGMPSAHAATVSALATAIAITQGLDSVVFAITAIVAIIVMYDAAGVRRAVSRQSIILNRIVKELRNRRPRDEVEHDLWEFIGHTPFQVIVGAALGILVAWLWLVVSPL